MFLIFLLFSTSLLFGQKDFDFDIIMLGSQIVSYPTFKVADSIPKGTEIRRTNFHYYLHDDADSFLFLNRPIYFVIAVADKKGQIVSISLVTKFDDDLLSDLQSKYGRWDTAALGTASESYDSLDTSRFSYYSWKKEKHGSISLSINRYMTSIGPDTKMNDYVIISSRSKAYWDK